MAGRTNGKGGVTGLTARLKDRDNKSSVRRRILCSVYEEDRRNAPNAAAADFLLPALSRCKGPGWGFERYYNSFV